MSESPGAGLHSLAGSDLNRDIASLDLILLDPSHDVTETGFVVVIGTEYNATCLLYYEGRTIQDNYDHWELGGGPSVHSHDDIAST